MKNLERIEQLKRYEDLLYKTVDELNSILIKNGIGYFDALEVFEKIGFTDSELIEFNIKDLDLEEELEFIG